MDINKMASSSIPPFPLLFPFTIDLRSNSRRYQQQQQPQPQQYNQGPPEYSQPSYGAGDKQDYTQTFKIAKPKLNDLWAGILFLATFAGFVAVSGLSISGYSSTKGQQGGGIYGSKTLELNTNTIVLL